MARKQSAEDRRRRLEEGCCPIHGTQLGGSSPWYEETDWERRQVAGKQYCLAHDSRKDCPLVVRGYVRADGEMHYEMAPEWEHVMRGESDFDFRPRGIGSQTHVDAIYLPSDMVERGVRVEGTITVTWSDADQGYVASLPELEGEGINPVACEHSCVAALVEAYYALRWLSRGYEREH
jgi:hypothetical protein